MKQILKILTIVFFISLFLTACGSKKHSPENQTILYNLKSEPKTLDPQAIVDASAEIVDFNIFEGLTRIDKNNKVIPAAAERWEHNDDYTSFTFYLRKDAVWTNKEKTPVTANDFVFALQRVVSMQTNPNDLDILYPIKNIKDIVKGKVDIEKIGVVALDDYTLKIDLEYSYEDFPRIMSTLSTMPCNKEFFENTNAEYGLECSTIICNGPFRIKSRYGWEHGKSLILLRNENYNGPNKAIPAGVTFSIGKDISDIISCIEDGMIDAGELDEMYLEQANNLNYNITSFEDVTWGLSFNFTNDMFKNLNIRKAFIQSINRENLISSLPQDVKVANDILSDMMIINGRSYREQAGSNFYLPHVESVSSMLEKGMKELGIKKLTNVTITCLNDSVPKTLANNVLEVWNSVTGQYFNINSLSINELKSAIRIGDFQAIIAPIYCYSNRPGDVLSTFKTNSVDNICDMKSEEYDKIIDSIETSIGDEKLNNCKKAEKYLNDNGAFYPLYYTKRYFASAPNVEGIVFYEFSNCISFIDAIKVKR